MTVGGAGTTICFAIAKNGGCEKKALSRWLVYALVLHVISMGGVDDGTENADSM